MANGEVERAAQLVAAQTSRTVDDVLLAWATPFPGDIPIDSLSNTELISLSNVPVEIVYTELNKIFERSKGKPQEQYLTRQYIELVDFWGRGIYRRAEAVRLARMRGLLPA